MITRKFPFRDECEIEVTFQWDNGDPSANVRPGWGEETGVVFVTPNARMVLQFEIMSAPGTNRDYPPELWMVTDITVESHGGIVWEHNAPHGLSEHPEILQAVKATWKQVQALEALERAQEALWTAQEEYDGLRAAYDEAYAAEMVA